MPGKRKSKKFIDPKVDVVHRFKVISRSQQDPLVADENAPQGVLCAEVPENNQHDEESAEFGIDFDDDYDYLQHIRGVKESIDWQNSELEVYTIRNEDKKVKHNESIGLVLPSSAFESYVEEPIGLLNRAAPITGPQPDLDPDLVEQMDRMSDIDGKYSDDDMSEDFITMLNSEEPLENTSIDNQDAFDSRIKNWLGHSGGVQDYDDMPALESSSDDEYVDLHKKRELNTVYEEENSNSDANEIDSDFNVSDDEEYRDDKDTNKCSNFLRSSESNDINLNHGSYDPLGYGGNYEGQKRNFEDNKSMISRVSHSSSLLPRTELMSQLNDRVQYVLEHEYGEDKWGALDGEVIVGPSDFDSDLFKQVFDSTVTELKKEEYSTCENTIQWTRNSQTVDDPDRANYIRIPRPVKEKYNCETILTKRVKYVNQPTIIDYRTGKPMIKTKNLSLTKKALSKHNKNEDDSDFDVVDDDAQTLKSMLSLLSVRPKKESSLDRRERKSSLKELRRERRIEKKISKDAFKEEKKNQIQNDLNIRKSKWRAVI